MPKTSNSRDETIAILAYQLWLERGRPVGSPEEDWFRAEQAFDAGAEPSSSRKQTAPADHGRPKRQLTSSNEQRPRTGIDSRREGCIPTKPAQQPST